MLWGIQSHQLFFTINGPPGCIGTANGSGWMQDFLVLSSTSRLTGLKSSLESKLLLVPDNHSCHLSVEGIDFCSHGIILLSFPWDCSHKLQHLGRSVYGPLKKLINNCCDSWMKAHPEVIMSIYDLPNIMKTHPPLLWIPFPICPHPKAGPRKQTTEGRWRREMAVFTDTPMKRQLEAQKSRSQAKRKMNFSDKTPRKPSKKLVNFDFMFKLFWGCVLPIKYFSCIIIWPLPLFVTQWFLIYWENCHS